MSAAKLSDNRGEIVRCAVEILEKEKNYRNIGVLGQGTFGDVRLMHHPQMKSAVAVKIVTSGFISRSELELWPKIDHPNVVPLLDLMLLREIGVVIFMMPVQKTSLDDILWEEKFQQHRKALNEVKKWLHQILCGLEYLHSKDLCHLDLKLDNVLISKASEAKLCDFTFLNTTTKPLGRHELGLPYIFRPPEVCPTVGPDVAVDGKCYDMWSYGVMATEIFTRCYIAATLRENNHWIRDIYPTMFDLLQVDNLYILMQATFIGAKLKKFHAEEALHFIHGFLNVDCKKRITATKAAQHPFLKRGIILGPPPDAIWIRKVQSDEDSCAKFKEKCVKNCDLKDEKVHTEESISESEVESMDYEESDERSYEHSNATDVPSKFSNGDDLQDESDFSDDTYVINEPSRIDFKEDIQTDEIGQRRWVEESNTSTFERTTENETAHQSEVEETTCNSPSVTKVIILEKSSFRLKINMKNVARYMSEMNGRSDIEERKVELSRTDDPGTDSVRKAVVDTDLDPVRKAPQAVAELAEGGESFFQGGCGNSIEEFEYKEKVNIGDRILQGENETLGEKESEILDIGSSKMLGRSRKAVQWMRNKYSELKRAVKRGPKPLKEKL